jgi:hypothetical protein
MAHCSLPIFRTLVTNPTIGELKFEKGGTPCHRKKLFACESVEYCCTISYQWAIITNLKRNLFSFHMLSNSKREFPIVIHYSCDRCKREIDISTDLRYTVTIEIEAALDGAEHELVDDPDHLDTIQEMLDSADSLCSSVFDDDVYQRKQFDLCQDCFRQYIKNPLSKESISPLGFSKN